MEDWQQKFLEVDLEDLYEDIAEIPVTVEELTEICYAIPCKVDLRMGNILNKIERMYQNKLSAYRKDKRLKWIMVNLRKIFPDPDASFLRWKQRNQKHLKSNWVKRKMLALDCLKEVIPIQNASQDTTINDPCCSDAVNKPLRRFSLISDRSETCSTTNGSVETVIASQPKTTQGTTELFENPDEMAPFIPFWDMNTSIEMSESVAENNTNYVGKEGTSGSISNTKNVTLPTQRKHGILTLLQESEGVPSSEDFYASFYQPAMVTSTQEFD